MSDMRIVPLTEIQQKVVEAVVARGGIIQHGDITAIAEETGASKAYVGRIINGDGEPGCQRVQAEIEKRLEAIPLGDPRKQLAVLQNMLRDQMRRREAAGKPMTNKDPADLIDIARRITHGESYLKILEMQAEKMPEPKVYDTSELSDDEINNAIRTIEAAVKSGKIGDVIDGEFEEESDTAPPALTSS
jgi:hypothetical protein